MIRYVNIPENIDLDNDIWETSLEEAMYLAIFDREDSSILDEAYVLPDEIKPGDIIFIENYIAPSGEVKSHWPHRMIIVTNTGLDGVSSGLLMTSKVNQDRAPHIYIDNYNSILDDADSPLYVEDGKECLIIFPPCEFTFSENKQKGHGMKLRKVGHINKDLQDEINKKGVHI